ncbi:low temperature requirement protein A [Micromonospora globispora]|uniref:low temperature requirement protein A n=1 Tax=Micromonospora globispora TaxID=1450148 RepID=UPI000F5FE00C|nr:low temperature requirement protein A [Micromonospora globispora]RQW88785.1 hypothetical protein DKL51_24320 [Micromonospora globispora]
MVFFAIRVVAERRGATTWHPHHIAERYQLFTLIVLGEVVLSTSVAIQSGIDAGNPAPIHVIAGLLCALVALTLIVRHRSSTRTP